MSEITIPVINSDKLENKPFLIGNRLRDEQIMRGEVNIWRTTIWHYFGYPVRNHPEILAVEPVPMNFIYDRASVPDKLRRHVRWDAMHKASLLHDFECSLNHLPEDFYDESFRYMIDNEPQISRFESFLAWFGVRAHSSIIRGLVQSKGQQAVDMWHTLTLFEQEIARNVYYGALRAVDGDSRELRDSVDTVVFINETVTTLASFKLADWSNQQFKYMEVK